MNVTPTAQDLIENCKRTCQDCKWTTSEICKQCQINKGDK